MRIIALLVMVFGVALGGGAIFFASKYFEDMKASMAQQEPDTVRVLVAKVHLSYGTRVTADNLQWVEWPRSAVPAGSFTSVQDLLGADGSAQRVVLRSIEPGEPVLVGKITEPGQSPRMAMNLTDGKRAVSIQIDAVSGVAGFVAPGDSVDILLTREQQGMLTSSVILQEITIIAVDQQANSESSSPRLGNTVTVEVDTTQAQKLALAQQIGRLSLTLRGFAGEDGATQPVAPVTEASLSDLAGPAPAAPADPGLSVRVRRFGVVADVVPVQEGATGQNAGADGQSSTGN
jgi:pilus assembly protein CpaB